MNYYQITKILPSQNIEPRQFLRYCFDIDGLPQETIFEEETNFSYCYKCVNLLSKILGMKKRTIREWGEDPNFGGMPHHAKLTCTYARVALSKEDLYKIANHQNYNAPKLTPMEFIEELFLEDLSPTERLKVTTSTKFRGQYLNLLSTTLKISKSTMYQWGRDMELRDMPQHYEHTLAYALTAYKRSQENIADRSAA